jgi:hypothetical protein
MKKPKTKAATKVVDAEVVSTAIVKAEPTPPVKEEWVWDKKKRVAFRMMLEGFGPVDIAKKIGVHRNTIRNWSHANEWLVELRNRIQEKQLSTKLRRLDLTEVLTDKLAVRAAQAINGEIPSFQLTGIFLKEYREYTKSERELYGENNKGGGGGGGPSPQGGALVNINVGGQTTPAENMSEIDAVSFRDFLKSRVAEGTTIEAENEQEALVAATREILMHTDALDQIHEADKKLDHEEAAKEEAQKRRR